MLSVRSSHLRTTTVAVVCLAAVLMLGISTLASHAEEWTSANQMDRLPEVTPAAPLPATAQQIGPGYFQPYGAGSYQIPAGNAPPQAPPGENPYGGMGYHPLPEVFAPAELWDDPGEDVVVLPPTLFDETEERLPFPVPKKSLLQRVAFDGAWLAPGGENGLGIYEMDLRTTLAFPILGDRPPLLVTPAFGVSYLDGPDEPYLPSRLYSTGVDLRAFLPVNERWVVEVGATPGVYSDFRTSNQAVRSPARVLGIYTQTEQLKWIVGAVYLDRDDVNFLPAAGLMWTPDEDTRWELIMPRPRYAKRFYVREDREWWWHVAAEFGGGSWAYRQEDGTDDVVTFRDYRLIFGVERRVWPSMLTRLDIGYVFGRKVDYESPLPNIEPDDTLMLRGTISY